MKVLIAEDDAVSRLLLENVLRDRDDPLRARGPAANDSRLADARRGRPGTLPPTAREPANRVDLRFATHRKGWHGQYRSRLTERRQRLSHQAVRPGRIIGPARRRPPRGGTSAGPERTGRPTRSGAGAREKAA